MSKNYLKLLSGVVLIVAFTGCQPSGKQDPYLSCLNIVMLDEISNNISAKNSADQAIKSCEPLFDDYILKTANKTARQNGWKKLNSHTYELFEKDAKNNVKKYLVDSYTKKGK
jgi:hypothetical protein